jgi:hypothetical protein
MLMSDTLSRLVSDYHAIAPNVNLRVSLQGSAVNLYDEHHDVAIVPPHLVEQSAMIRRTLSKSSNVLVASPACLDKYGIPLHAEDLSTHFLLVDPRLRQQHNACADAHVIERGPMPHKRWSV